MQYVQGGTEIMIKRLLKSVREFKKDALLTPFFVVLEVVMEAVSYTHLTLPTKRIV